MSRPRVLLAGLYHESHSFVADRTPAGEFRWRRGHELLDAAGDVSPLAGAVETAAELGWDVRPAVMAEAAPGGLAEDEVLEQWWAELAPHLAEPLDGAFLVLHGAMATPAWPDAEGELLRRLRGVAGGDLPIGGVTDLHANVSPAMVAATQLLVTYRENPHIDARQTAVRAARSFDRVLHEPGWRQQLVQVPLILPPTATGTAAEPMRSLAAAARRLEARDDVLCVNIHAGYAFADTPDTGLSISATARGETSFLADLARLAWHLRGHARPTERSIAEAIAETRRLLADRSPAGPVVLAEPADNIGGGAPGTGTWLIRELLAGGLPGVTACLCDAAAVARLGAVGSRARLVAGGGGLSGPPLELEVDVVRRSDGEFELEDPRSHLAAAGRLVRMGDCAVVRPVGSDALLLLTSRRVMPFDLGQWRSQGIAPESRAIIVVKAAVAHRRAYDPIARAHLLVATPGPCASDLTSLPYRLVRRPIVPLDAEETAWAAA